MLDGHSPSKRGSGERKKMESLDDEMKKACIEEVRAKTEHLRAQAALWLSQAELNKLEAKKK